MEGKGDKATAEGMELLRGEVEKLKEHVKLSEDGLYAFPHAPVINGFKCSFNKCASVQP